MVLGDLTEVLLNLLRRSASSSRRAGRARFSVGCEVGRGLVQFFLVRGGVPPARSSSLTTTLPFGYLVCMSRAYLEILSASVCVSFSLIWAARSGSRCWVQRSVAIASTPQATSAAPRQCIAIHEGTRVREFCMTESVDSAGPPGKLQRCKAGRA